jgi:hypothetical protein
MRLEGSHQREQLSYSTWPDRAVGRGAIEGLPAVRLTSHEAPPKISDLDKKLCYFDGASPLAAQRLPLG